MSGRNKNEALIYKLLGCKNDKAQGKEESEGGGRGVKECKRERSDKHNNSSSNNNNNSISNSNSKLSSMINMGNVVNSSSKNGVSSKVKENVVRNNSSSNNNSNKKVVSSSSMSSINNIKNKPSSVVVPLDKKKENINKTSSNIKHKQPVRTKDENILHEKVLTSSVSELAKLYLTHKKDFQQLFNNPSSSSSTYNKPTTPSTHKPQPQPHQQKQQHKQPSQQQHKPKPTPPPQTNHKHPPSHSSPDNTKYLSKKRNPPPSSTSTPKQQQQHKPLPPQKHPQQPLKKPQPPPPQTKIACNLCKCYHYPNQHIHPPNNNSKQHVNTIQPSKKQSQPPLPTHKPHKEYDPLNTFKYNSNKTTLHSVFQKPKSMIVQKKSKPKINGYFSREDFEKGNDYDDDFYDDDDNEDFREEMESVLKQFRKGGNHDYRNGYYDNGDIEEATFEMLQDEESKSRKIGKIEDEEELRKLREAEEEEDEEEEDDY